tara:strand:+ start:265 stop:1131 length:867 start_codon:yes stop_codon:yes gene_type:complete
MADTGTSILGAAHTVSTADDFVPEIWADGIYRFFERGTVFKNLIDDYSSLVNSKGFGDTINIPQIDLKTATAKGADTLVTYDATATTNTQLTITDHYYNAMLFEDVLMIQSEADLISKYTKMFGEALARQLDADIWDDLDGLNVSVALGSGDDNLAVGDWQAALASLGENDVPYMDGECSMVVNPTMMADILDPDAGVSKYFWRADAGGNTVPLNEGGTKGFMGKLHGINVYMSNTISTGGSVCCGAIFHKSAAAVAVQQGVRVQSEYSIDALGTKSSCRSSIWYCSD